MARFEMLVHAVRDGFVRAQLVLDEALLVDYEPVLHELAEVLLRASQSGAPKVLRKLLAKALLDTLDGTPEAHHSARVTLALQEARRLVRSRAKPKPAATKKSRAKKVATPKAEKPANERVPARRDRARARDLPARQQKLFGDQEPS